jgi:putative isomerase
MKSNRREFLKQSSALVLGGILSGNAFSAFAKDGLPNIRDYFEWEDEAVIQLVESVFAKCVFGKIHPPEGELKRRWNAPGGDYYGQWLWDTMFVTDLLSIFPEQREVIHDIFGNYRDFQERWNAVKPEYMHNMIPCMMMANDKSGKWKTFPAYSQIPILAWGLERVFNRNGDVELVKENLQSLENFHEWYWRERDVTDAGLVGLGDYLGDIQNARFETFDFDRTLDRLQLTAHPVREDNPPLKAYGDILVTGNTSYLILAEQSLARLAKKVGNKKLAKRCETRAARAAESMRKNMWDEKNGVFKAIFRDSFQKIDELSIGCWMPLLAGVPTKKQATKMVEVLQSPAWNTPVPVPTAPTTDPIYKSGAFWRGDIWTVTNYQIAHGLKAYGFDELAADIADKTIELSLRHGVSERHDSQTGKALGVDFLGMSCTVVTLMLEGISRKYVLKLKNK